jgi:hypothetical protein
LVFGGPHGTVVRTGTRPICIPKRVALISTNLGYHVVAAVTESQNGAGGTRASIAAASHKDPMPTDASGEALFNIITSDSGTATVTSKRHIWYDYRKPPLSCKDQDQGIGPSTEALIAGSDALELVHSCPPSPSHHVAVESAPLRPQWYRRSPYSIPIFTNCLSPYRRCHVHMACSRDCEWLLRCTFGDEKDNTKEPHKGEHG